MQSETEHTSASNAETAVCSWCQPVNTARNHTICALHEAQMQRQIEAIKAAQCEAVGRGE